MKKLIPFALALCLMFTAACQTQPSSSPDPTTAPSGENTQTTQPSQAPEEKEIVTLSMFTAVGVGAIGDMQEQWYQQVLRDDIGVQLDIMPADSQTTPALLASGDLPDIFITNNVKDMTNAVAGDLLICLDDHLDKLPNVAANASNALQYWRDNLSEGTDKAYAISDRISMQPQTAGNTNMGPALRWDLYQELGTPTIATFEGLLDVMEQMQALYPTNAEGLKAYGFSLFSDWDGNTPNQISDMGNFFGTPVLGSGFLQVNYNDESSMPIFDESSTYMRLLQFFFDANQRGLLDPDSITQGYADYSTKMAAGRVLYCPWTWSFESFNTEENVAQGIGFRPIYTQDMKVTASGIQPTGKSWPMAIGKGTKNLDAALAYVDYMYSFDGVMKLMNGPQGLIWDFDESGVPFVTQEGYEYIADSSKLLPGGGSLASGINVVNTIGLSNWAVHPGFNLPLDNSSWPKKDYAPADSTLVAEWKEFYQAEDVIRYLSANDMIAYTPFAPMSTVPEEIVQIDSRVGSVVTRLSWQMIYAKDQAEFDSLKASMVEQAEGLGVQTSLDWYSAAYAEALAEGKLFQ